MGQAGPLDWDRNHKFMVKNEDLIEFVCFGSVLGWSRSGQLHNEFM